MGRRTVQKLAISGAALENPAVRRRITCAAAETLAKWQPSADHAGVNPLQFFLLCLADWINRNQQKVIESLQEEVTVLREQLGKKPKFNDDQRRRLAAKAKKIALKHLKGIATVATPRTLLNWHQRWIAH